MKTVFKFLTTLATLLICLSCFSSDVPCLPPNQVLVTNITDTSAVVRWSRVSGVSKYQLRLLKLVDTSYQEVFIQLIPDTVKVLTNLTPNTNYKIEVRSECSKGVYSTPKTQVFLTSGIIIDDIVFLDSKAPYGSQPCVGKTIQSTNSYTNNVSVNLTKYQAMRVKIIGGNIKDKIRGKTLSEFVIARNYSKSPKNALWTLLHDKCEKNGPSLSTEKTNIVNRGVLQGANIVWTRNNNQFKLNFNKNTLNSVTLSLQNPNTYAVIEIYNVL